MSEADYARRPAATLRHERDGPVVTLAEQHASEIVVDARGNIYINGADFDFVGGGAPKPGYITLVTPGGQLRQVAGDLQFPNGMVITPDNRTLIISESCSPAALARTASPWMPRARSGSAHPSSRSSGSRRAAKPRTASNCPTTRPRSPSCSPRPTAA